jgi:hypothetical protein
MDVEFIETELLCTCTCRKMCTRCSEQLSRPFLLSHFFLRAGTTGPAAVEYWSRAPSCQGVQLISSLGNAIFGLIPFAGAAVADSFAGAASLFEALHSGSAVKSMLGSGGNAQVLATLALVDRVFYGGRLVLKAEVLAQMPVERRRFRRIPPRGLGCPSTICGG